MGIAPDSKVPWGTFQPKQLTTQLTQKTPLKSKSCMTLIQQKTPHPMSKICAVQITTKKVCRGATNKNIKDNYPIHSRVQFGPQGKPFGKPKLWSCPKQNPTQWLRLVLHRYQASTCFAMLSINMNQVLGNADRNQHCKQGERKQKRQRVLEQRQAAEFQLLAQQGGRPHKE